MIKIAISVEGLTEYNFCESILQPYFHGLNVEIESFNLNGETKKVKEEIKNIANSYHNFNIVSTLYDFYGFPNPSKKKTKSQIEQEIAKQTKKYFKQSQTFIPYLQEHEFEALLFSDIDKIQNEFPRANVSQLQAALKNANRDPEKINHNSNPSHRIINCIPEYNKPAYGEIICEEIGLQKIRQECKGFNQWIEELETAIAHYP